MRRAFAISLLALLALLSGGTAHARASMTPFEPGSLEQILIAHKGEPFVLIVWSLDCLYCQASLTALAQEKRLHPQMKIVTLATDPIGDSHTEGLLAARLRGVGLLAGAWAFGETPPVQLRFAIDPKWHGEMPRSYWFDAQGKRVAYSGILTPATIKRLSAH